MTRKFVADDTDSKVKTGDEEINRCAVTLGGFNSI